MRKKEREIEKDAAKKFKSSTFFSIQAFHVVCIIKQYECNIIYIYKESDRKGEKKEVSDLAQMLICIAIYKIYTYILYI